MSRLFLTVSCAGLLTYVVGLELWKLSIVLRVTSGLWSGILLVLALGLFARVFKLE